MLGRLSMPELHFQIEGAEAVAHAAIPLIALKLRIAILAAETVHTLTLRCQVQIDPANGVIIGGFAREHRVAALVGDLAT
jgi:hypothetical protein